MSTKTPNYNLVKPDYNDTADIMVLNGNMDILDGELKKIEDSITTAPVLSVNGKTGAVVLAASDVGAATESDLTAHINDTAKHTGYAVTTNSGNAYSVTIPNLSTLTDGLQIRVKFNAASTGAITINVNNLGTKNIKDYFGNSVTNVRVNLIANLAFESTSNSFILQGKGGGGNAGTDDILSGKTATVDTGQITGTMPDKVGSNTTIIPAMTTDTPVPKGYYGGAITDGVVSAYNKMQIAAGDNVLMQMSESKIMQLSAWGKIAEAQMNFGGTVRIKYTCNNSNQSSANYYKLYKNGVAVGTSHTVSPGYVTSYTEDIACVIGDKLQIYGYSQNTGDAPQVYLSKFAVCGNLTPYAVII